MIVFHSKTYWNFALSFSFDSQVKLDYFSGTGNWPRRRNQLPDRQGCKCKSASVVWAFFLSLTVLAALTCCELDVTERRVTSLISELNTQSWELSACTALRYWFVIWDQRKDTGVRYRDSVTFITEFVGFSTQVLTCRI